MSCESAAVIGGPSGFQTHDGSLSITHLPFTDGRYAARLSAEPLIRTTPPVTVLPPVPSVQAQLCAVIGRGNGVTSARLASPRSHVTPKGNDSSWPVSP